MKTFKDNVMETTPYKWFWISLFSFSVHVISILSLDQWRKWKISIPLKKKNSCSKDCK